MEQEIIKAANQLAAEGKQPTVALLKTRLTQTVSMPLLLTTLSRWKAAPEKFRAHDGDAPPTAHSPTEERSELQEIKQQMKTMQSQLDTMQQLLERLVNQEK